MVVYENKQIYKGISRMKTTLGNGRYVRVSSYKIWHSEYRPVSQARREKEQAVILPIEMYCEQRPIRMVGSKSFALLEYMLRVFRDDIVPIKISDKNYSQELCDAYVREMNVPLAKVEDCDYMMISDWSMSEVLYEKNYKVYDVRTREFHDRQDITLVHSISAVPKMMGYKSVYQNLSRVKKRFTVEKGEVRYKKALNINTKYWYHGSIADVRKRRKMNIVYNLTSNKDPLQSTNVWESTQLARVYEVTCVEGIYSVLEFKSVGVYRFIVNLASIDDRKIMGKVLDINNDVTQIVLIADVRNARE